MSEPVQAAEQAADVNLPEKAPASFEMLIKHDGSGLKIGDIVGAFVFRYPKDPYSGGADRQKLQFDEDGLRRIEEIFNVAMGKFIAKHGTCSVEEALKLPAPTPAQ